MAEINEDLVARVATRLYNEVSGGHPVSLPAGELPRDASVLAQRIRDEISTKTGTVPAQAEGSAALEQISEIFERLGNSPAVAGRKAGADAADARLSRQSIPSKLSGHANTFIQEQTLQADRDAHGNLRSFVEKIQYCKRAPSKGSSPDSSTDPFTILLKESLARKATFTAQAGFNVEEVRRDFPALHQKVHGKPLVWFDNAATTQKPRVVIETLNDYYARDNSNIHRGAHTLAARSTEAFENSREKIREYLNAGSASEIIFVRGTTEGINLVARSYGSAFLRQGDEIVLSVLEHHANIVPWQIVARETGAVLRVIPVNDQGEIELDAYQRLLGPRTRLVALTHASNSLGTVLPVQEMTALAKKYGAHVLIDGAQSVSHLPVDVQAINCDFFVFSGHKIFGPTGIGAVYGRRELLEAMPPWQAGGNMIRTVTFEETTYNDIPAKFEAGTPNVADAVGLGAALDYVRRIGLDAIAGYEHRLLEHATEQLRGINDLRLIGTAANKVAVVSFVHNRLPVEEIGRHLDREGIAVRAGHHCAQPSLRRFGLDATVRPSFAFYNTISEIEHLVRVLKQLR